MILGHFEVFMLQTMFLIQQKRRQNGMFFSWEALKKLLRLWDKNFIL